MAIGQTMKSLESYMEKMLKDLKKVAKGNKAAAQRVRTSTIKFEKIAKKFRKESMKAGAVKKPKAAAKKKKPAKKKAAAKKRTTAKRTTRRTTARKTARKPARRPAKRRARR